MCDNCDNFKDELHEKEVEFLGGEHGARQIKQMGIAMNPKGEIVLTQTIEVAFINEEGVTKHEKTSFIYVDPRIMIQMVTALMDELGDENG